MPKRTRTVSANVTVDRPRAEVEGSEFLDPLRRFGQALEVSFSDGPGEWGTEVHARWRTAGSTSETVGALQRAVREVRALAETGEVLRNEPRPAGLRRRTLGGALVDWAEARSDRFVWLRRFWA